MTVGVLINPGTGPVPGALLADARENMQIFIEDVDLKNPRVTSRRMPRYDEDGRFGWRLRRGNRSCSVEMPGRPLEELRVDGFSARLYIDGNSYYWKFAVEMAHDVLFDHDGSIERTNKRTERRTQRQFKRAPRCPTCDSIREVQIIYGRLDKLDEGRLRCFVCAPHVKEYKLTRLPDQALGTDDDPICGRYVTRWPFGISSAFIGCRLSRRHTEPCEGQYKVEVIR